MIVIMGGGRVTSRQGLTFKLCMNTITLCMCVCVYDHVYVCMITCICDWIWENRPYCHN